MPFVALARDKIQFFLAFKNNIIKVKTLEETTTEEKNSSRSGRLSILL